MTENNLILSDQIEGYPHPKVIKTLFGHHSAEQDFINSGFVGDSFLWVQTSYNKNFRKNFASIGFTYDKYFIFLTVKLTIFDIL